jgi:hypothetical protein
MPLTLTLAAHAGRDPLAATAHATALAHADRLFGPARYRFPFCPSSISCIASVRRAKIAASLALKLPRFLPK